MSESNFKLGAVVLTATDGLLAELGYDVKALGPMALGVVIEEGSKRSHVHFPELKVSLWLDHSEIKDVHDEIKVNLRTSRKNLLLLNKVIERGINGKESEDKSISVLESIPKETLQEIWEIAVQLLNKAGLSEMNEKLKSF